MNTSILPKLVLVLFTTLTVACSQAEVEESSSDEALAKPAPEWVVERVAASKARLEQTEAGQLVWKSIEYHGGLEKWFNNGPLYFRFNYQPKPGTGTPRDTYETADYWASKARHQRVVDPKQEYGWDGEKAWYYPADADIPYNTRFWALTPYYFFGMPFVFADEGVNLAKEEDMEYDGKTYHIVRVTFGENVGDAPDDYYVLYIDPASSRLSAIRYVVSYPAYFPDGGHTQEKLMTYEGEQTIEGITLPEKHRTFMWEPNDSIGTYVTDITVSDVAFLPETPKAYFDIPEGSKVIEGLAE